MEWILYLLQKAGAFFKYISLVQVCDRIVAQYRKKYKKWNTKAENDGFVRIHLSPPVEVSKETLKIKSL
ncbi:hypothetical protein [Flavobacterium reichenbachii]|uniref:hypothetical protein n=1 Tax=Flavobacterium reichenbachii TaxID=362418 RepID=UPI000F4EEA2E|nr:hypothetical protein [Flavobacterium reichenbachii]